MFKVLLSSLIGLSVSLSPLGQVSAQEFIYRHKYPVTFPEPPIKGEEIGVGNDVVAYYTAPVGYAFQKRIPVKTTEVDRWVMESGDMPSGIVLDRTDGVHSGEPEVEQTVTQRLSGFDAANNRIAKAEVHFDVRKPQGIEVPIRFLAHKGHYSYNILPSPEGVDVERWDPWMVMPEGMAMRNEALEGIPLDSREYTLLWQGYDYMNRPVAFAYGDLVVTDGPSIDAVAAQEIDPARGQSFRIEAVAHNIISTPVYRLITVDGERPDGIVFNSETGLLSGNVAEFDWKASFKIRVTDSHDGTFAETPPFVLSTTPPTFAMDEVKDLVATIGESKSFGFNVKTAVPGLTWSLAPESGGLPPGLRVTPDTQYAYIGGAPQKLGEWPGIVLMATAPGFEQKTPPFKITVRERGISVQAVPFPTRVGQPIKTDGLVISRGRADPVHFEFAEPQSIPTGMTIDRDTGSLTLDAGYPAIGSYRIPIRIVNGDGQKPVHTQYIQVYPDLEIAYLDTVFTRYSFRDRAVPVLDLRNVAGNPKFSIEPALPVGLVLDDNGSIVPAPDQVIPASVVGAQEYVVSIEDDAGDPVYSKPFRIEIKDRPEIVPAQGVVEVERYGSYNRWNRIIPVAAEHAYPIGSARYTYTGNLPEGLKIGEYGYFEGSTKAEAGEFPGIVVTVTDGDGHSQPFGPFTVKLNQAKPIQVLDGDLNKSETWPAGYDFSFQLPRPYNGRSPIKWTLIDAPAGVSVSPDGVLMGNIALTGTYVIAFQIGDDTARVPVPGSLALTIEEPFEFEPADWNAYKNKRFAPPEGKIGVLRGIKPFTWTLDTPLPSGWTFSSGQLYGTPTSSTGGVNLDVTMWDRAGVKKQFSTFVKFNPPQPLSVSYDAKTLFAGVATGLPMTPRLSDPSIDIGDWAPVDGLPSGILFDKNSGEFIAAPYPADSAVGTHVVNVTPRPLDTDVELAESSFPVTLNIGYSGEIDFADTVFRHRRGKNFTQKLAYDRAVEPVIMAAVDLGAGVVFDANAQTLSSRFDEIGTHFGGTIKIEENDHPAFNRERTSSFRFEIVDDLAFTVPSEMNFGQYDFKSVGITEVLNVIGDGNEATPDVTYGKAEGYPDLPEGLSVNRLTGALEGAPEAFGVFGPFAITAYDAYGDSVDSNEFTVTVGERKQIGVSYPQGFSHFTRYGVHASAPDLENGYGPYKWSIDRPLPAGLDFDTETGVFTASTDELLGQHAFSVTVVDSKGGEKGTAEVDVVIEVTERPALSLKYEAPTIAFTRHVVDGGKAPTVANLVGRGGSLQFTQTPVNGEADLASCISFDETTGRFSTDPACTSAVPQADYKVTVTDRTWRDYGNADGRAEFTLRIGVQERPKIALKYPDYDSEKESFGFKRHHARTVHPAWENPITSDVEWSIQPTPPAGIAFNEDGSITVDSASLIETAPYVITVSDDFDGVQTFRANLGVGERDKLVFEQSAGQEVPLNSEYELTLSVMNVIGDSVSYEVVSGQLPANLVFDADGTGACGIPATVCGMPDPGDHGKTFVWTIKARDSFDGVSDDFPITFTVVEDATPMKVTYGEPGKARVGYAYKAPAPTVEFAVGNPAFSAPALSQYGLSINSKTGEITGTPNTTFDLSFDVTVTDKLGAARAVTVSVPVISVPSPTVVVPNPVSILFNRDIPEDQQPVHENVELPARWTLDPTTPPPGLSFNPETGLFSGRATDIGTFGQYTLTLNDSLPGSFPSVFSFDIAMNGDPIELEELSVMTKVGFPFQTKAPAYANNLGPAKFSSPELTALGLTVDPATGVVSGSLSAEPAKTPNLFIRDNTIRTTSMPVRLRILPRLRLTAPETIYMTAFEPLTPKASVTSAFAAGPITWNAIDPQFLPGGVIYDNDGTKGCGAVATFCGTPLKAETLGPFQVTATDHFGDGLTDTASSNPITIVVRKGLFAMEFFPGELPVATKRHAYSFNLLDNGMFAYEGMDLSAIEFSMVADETKGEALPPGISITGGVLSGIPTDEGTYVFDIVSKYSNKPEVRGKFTLVMKLPATELSLAAADTFVGEKYEPFSFDFRSLLTHTEIPFEKVTWEPLVALPNDEAVPKTHLPSEITMSTAGLFSGTPQRSGMYTFSVPVSFTDKTEDLKAAKTYKLIIRNRVYQFTKMAVGENFSCGVDLAQKVLCWGQNNYTQLGHGFNESPTLKYSLDPREVELSAAAVDVVASASQACALLADGKLKCWGNGNNGDGKFDTQKKFGSYVASNANHVAVGSGSTCYIDTAKRLWCSGVWTGINGNNDFTYVWNEITNARGIAESVSVNGEWGCAVTTGGGVICFGSGDRENYGNKPWLNPSPVPTSAQPYGVMVNGLRAAATSVVALNKRACASLVDGTVQCWGNTGLSSIRTDVVQLVSASAFSTDTLCTINRGGTYTCTGSSTTSFPKTGNAGLDLAVSLSHICVAESDGFGYCAGSGSSGALGNGETRSSNTFLKVVGK